MRLTQDGKRFVKATTVLFGVIIGVGIFGVPYTLSRAGVWVGLAYFVGLAAIQLLQHLFLAEAAMASSEPRRVPGLARQFLGPRVAKLAGLATLFGMWASLLAYIVVGGTFLHVLLSPLVGGSVFMYQIAWALIGTLVLRYGLDVVAKVDAYATLAMVAAVVIIFVWGSRHVFAVNYAAPFMPDYLVPYGVIMFSLAGIPAVTEMEDILAGRHRFFRLAVVCGVVLAALVTAAFGFMVLGITGAATTPDAVGGLRNVLRGGMATVVGLFGFFATATSFFPTGENIKATLQFDYGMGRTRAWLVAVGVPLAVFLLGAKDFIRIIGFAGAVFGGITGIVVSLIYVAVTRRRMLGRNGLGVPVGAAYAVATVFALGIVVMLWSAVQK